MLAGDIDVKLRLLISELATTRFTQANTLGFINDAQRQLAMDLDFPEAKYQILTIAGQQEYQLIECIKILQVYALVNYNPNTGAFTTMQPILPADKPTLMSQQVEGYDQSSNFPNGNTFTPQLFGKPPQVYPVQTGNSGGMFQSFPQPTQQQSGPFARPKYYLRGGNIGFDPIPEVPVYIQVEMLPSPPDMGQLTSLCIFPAICKDALAYKAAAYCALSDNSSRVEGFEALYMREIREKLKPWKQRLQAGKSKMMMPVTTRTYFRGNWEV